MTLIHCSGCWQPMSAFVRRCPRCGHIDKYRIRRAVVKLAIFFVVAAMVLGLTLRAR
jgi:uncharacterized paraquat-inducible protein A